MIQQAEMFIFFVYNGADGALYVGNVITENNGEKGDLEFINDYGAENDTTHDVTIKKRSQVIRELKINPSNSRLR